MTPECTINGVRVAAPDGALAYKYADPVEDARWIYDADEWGRIASEDPSLIVPVVEPRWKGK